MTSFVPLLFKPGKHRRNNQASQKDVFQYGTRVDRQQALVVVVVGLLFIVGLVLAQIHRAVQQLLLHAVPTIKGESLAPLVDIPIVGSVPKTSAKPCPRANLQNPATRAKLASQQGEDVFLLDYFNGLCEGTYLEMGALDGVTYSNTYFFNQLLGWKGLLVELSPVAFTKLQVNRQNELAVVHAAVCNGRQPNNKQEQKTKVVPLVVHYYDKGAVSGVWEFATESFRRTWWPDVTLRDTTPVSCRSLQDIMDQDLSNTTMASRQQHQRSTFYFFDFMSLDCEGCEWSAVESIDWSRTAFGMICIEADANNPRKNSKVRTFLELQGYMLRRSDIKTNTEWLVHSQFDSIYSHHTPHKAALESER